MRLTLLTRAGCGLCDEMLAELEPLLEAHGAQVSLVDVDERPELEARFGRDVPVLMAGDEVVCRHHLDPTRVTRLLAG